MAVNGIKGSKSSFDTWNNVENRHVDLTLTEEMKDLIVYDDDLSKLIVELGYTKIEL